MIIRITFEFHAPNESALLNYRFLLMKSRLKSKVLF